MDVFHEQRCFADTWIELEVPEGPIRSVLNLGMSSFLSIDLKALLL